MAMNRSDTLLTYNLNNSPTLYTNQSGYFIFNIENQKIDLNLEFVEIKLYCGMNESDLLAIPCNVFVEASQDEWKSKVRIKSAGNYTSVRIQPTASNLIKTGTKNSYKINLSRISKTSGSPNVTIFESTSDDSASNEYKLSTKTLSDLNKIDHPFEITHFWPDRPSVMYDNDVTLTWSYLGSLGDNNINLFCTNSKGTITESNLRNENGSGSFTYKLKENTLFTLQASYLSNNNTNHLVKNYQCSVLLEKSSTISNVVIKDDTGGGKSKGKYAELSCEVNNEISYCRLSFNNPKFDSLFSTMSYATNSSCVWTIPIDLSLYTFKIDAFNMEDTLLCSKVMPGFRKVVHLNYKAYCGPSLDSGFIYFADKNKKLRVFKLNQLENDSDEIEKLMCDEVSKSPVFVKNNLIYYRSINDTLRIIDIAFKDVRDFYPYTNTLNLYGQPIIISSQSENLRLIYLDKNYSLNYLLDERGRFQLVEYGKAELSHLYYKPLQDPDSPEINGYLFYIDDNFHLNRQTILSSDFKKGSGLATFNNIKLIRFSPRSIFQFVDKLCFFYVGDMFRVSVATMSNHFAVSENYFVTIKNNYYLIANGSIVVIGKYIYFSGVNLYSLNLLMRICTDGLKQTATDRRADYIEELQGIKIIGDPVVNQALKDGEDPDYIYFCGENQGLWRIRYSYTKPTRVDNETQAIPMKTYCERIGGENLKIQSDIVVTDNHVIVRDENNKITLVKLGKKDDINYIKYGSWSSRIFATCTSIGGIVTHNRDEYLSYKGLDSKLYTFEKSGYSDDTYPDNIRTGKQYIPEEKDLPLDESNIIGDPFYNREEDIKREECQGCKEGKECKACKECKAEYHIYFNGDNKLKKVYVSVTPVGNCNINDSPFVFDKMVYFSGDDSKLKSISINAMNDDSPSDISDCQTKSRPFVDKNGIYYINASDNKLHMVYKISDEQYKKIILSNCEVFTSPVVYDNYVYTSLKNDCINDNTAYRFVRFNINHENQSPLLIGFFYIKNIPAITSDGKIIFRNSDDNLIALLNDTNKPNPRNVNTINRDGLSSRARFFSSNNTVNNKPDEYESKHGVSIPNGI